MIRRLNRRRLQARHFRRGRCLALALYPPRRHPRAMSSSTKPDRPCCIRCSSVGFRLCRSQPDVKITVAATGSGEGIKSAIDGDRADRHLGRLHVGRRGGAKPPDPQCAAGDFGADGELQPARPGGRRCEARRSHPSPASIPARSGSGTIPAIVALNPGVKLPHHADRSGPPRRRLGRYVRVHPVPRFLHPAMGRQSRLRHHRRLAQGAGGTRRDRKRRHGQDDRRDALFDRLYRHQLQRGRRQGRAGTVG